jgi:LCP family protein required for cell wall assembly
MNGRVIDQKHRDHVIGSAAVNDDDAWYEEPPARRGRPELATFLSFVWPGLGQVYAGRGVLALLFGLPIVVLAGLAIYLFLEDREAVAFRMFTPGVALGITGVIVAAGLWRLLSMLHANAASGGRRAWTARPLVVLLVLSVVVVAAHLGVARLTWSFHEEAGNIFTGRDPFVGEPVPTFVPEPGGSVDPGAPPPGSGDPGASPLPSGSFVPLPSQELPAETPLTGPPPSVAPDPVAPESDRLNVLITGLDSGPGRNHALTDTLIVVSVDRSSGDVAMVSFPRDIASFPLSDGRTYRGKINSLLTYARQHPDQFSEPPMKVLARETGHLLGLRVDYYAAIDLQGFERLIDTVGGVTVYNERDIDDPGGFDLAAGWHTLDGYTALHYVRTRKGAGDSDFTRAARQQQVLLALRSKLTDLSILPRLPDILDALAGTITTNYPPELLAETVELGRNVSDDGVRQYVLGPPYSWHPPTSQTGGSWELRLDLDRVAALSVELFGEDSRYALTGAP